MDLDACTSKTICVLDQNLGNATNELIDLLLSIQWESITFQGRPENKNINGKFLNSGVAFQTFKMPMTFLLIADVYIDYYSYIIIGKKNDLYFLFYQNSDFYWYDDKIVCHNSLEELVHYGLDSHEKSAFIDKIKDSLEDNQLKEKFRSVNDTSTGSNTGNDINTNGLVDAFNRVRL